MAWKFESGIPISVQVSARLRTDILSGVYKPGERFPTVRQLAAISGVNPNTMQKSLVQLEEESLLVTHSTNGRIVTTDLSVLEDAKARVTEERISEIIDAARGLGLTQDELIEYIRKGWNEKDE